MFVCICMHCIVSLYLYTLYARINVSYSINNYDRMVAHAVQSDRMLIKPFATIRGKVGCFLPADKYRQGSDFPIRREEDDDDRRYSIHVLHVCVRF